MVSVEWSDLALQGLEELDPVIRERVLAKISWLGSNFGGIIPEPLHHDLRGLYKLRVGDYRAEYSMHDNTLLIEAVGHRRDVYR